MKQRIEVHFTIGKQKYCKMYLNRTELWNELSSAEPYIDDVAAMYKHQDWEMASINKNYLVKMKIIENTISFGTVEKF